LNFVDTNFINAVSHRDHDPKSTNVSLFFAQVWFRPGEIALIGDKRRATYPQTGVQGVARRGALCDGRLRLDTVPPKAGFSNLWGRFLLTIAGIERELNRRISLVTTYHAAKLRALVRHLTDRDETSLSEPHARAGRALFRRQVTRRLNEIRTPQGRNIGFAEAAQGNEALLISRDQDRDEGRKPDRADTVTAVRSMRNRSPHPRPRRRTQLRQCGYGGLSDRAAQHCCENPDALCCLRSYQRPVANVPFLTYCQFPASRSRLSHFCSGILTPEPIGQFRRLRNSGGRCMDTTAGNPAGAIRLTTDTRRNMHKLRKSPMGSPHPRQRELLNVNACTTITAKRTSSQTNWRKTPL